MGVYGVDKTREKGRERVREIYIVVETKRERGSERKRVSVS